MRQNWANSNISERIDCQKNESTQHKNMVRHEVNDGESIGAVRYLVRMGQHGEKNDLRII